MAIVTSRSREHLRLEGGTLHVASWFVAWRLRIAVDVAATLSQGKPSAQQSEPSCDQCVVNRHAVRSLKRLSRAMAKPMPFVKFRHRDSNPGRSGEGRVS